MDFLKSIGSGLVNNLTSFGNFLMSGVSGSNSMQSNMGNFNPPSEPIPMSVPPPNTSTPFGPAYTPPNSTQQFIKTPAGAVNVQGVNPNQSSVIPGTTGGGITPIFGNNPAVIGKNIRPLVTQPQQTNAPQPGMPGTGGRPTPLAGTTGVAGVGGNQTSTPQQSFNVGGISGGIPSMSTGEAGVSGGSAKTGLLGAAGGLNTSSVGSTVITPEEEKRRAVEILTKNPTSNQSGNIVRKDGVFVDITTGQVLGRDGAGASPRFDVATPKTPYNVSDILSGQANTDIQNLIKGGLSRPESLQLLNNTIETAKNEITRLQALPENPVKETPEQDAFVNSQQGNLRVTMRQQMDASREKYGLPGLEKNRIDVMNTIQASNQAFTAIIKDIRDNPNLPKGLAARRIQEFTRENSINIQNLIGQLDILNQQIGDANSLVNQEFKIEELAQNQENRLRDDMRQNLNMLITSGAIGNLSDADLQKYADGSGITIESLKAMRDKIKSKGGEITNIQWKDDGKGNLTAVGIDANNKPVTLGNISGVTAPDKPTADQKDVAELSKIESQLSTSKGEDGFVDPGIFQSLRQKSGISPDEFNKRFGFMLSEAEQARLGIKAGGTNTPYLNEAWLVQRFGGYSGLYASAAEEGYRTGFFGGDQEAKVKEWLSKSLMPKVHQYRAAGFTDDVIVKILNLE